MVALDLNAHMLDGLRRDVIGLVVECCEVQSSVDASIGNERIATIFDETVVRVLRAAVASLGDAYEAGPGVSAATCRVARDLLLEGHHDLVAWIVRLRAVKANESDVDAAEGLSAALSGIRSRVERLLNRLGHGDEVNDRG